LRNAALVLQLQLSMTLSQSSLVVTAAGDGLVSSAPVGPGQRLLGRQERVPDQATQ
jgi:hypothetical protein